MKLGIKRNCQKPKLKFRQWLHDIVSRPMFEYFIGIVIFLNICVLVTYHYDQPQTFTDFQYYLNGCIPQVVMDIIFTVIYVMEAGAKIVAWFPKHYFGNWWNVLDFLIALLSVVALFLTAFLRLLHSGYCEYLEYSSHSSLLSHYTYSLPAMANVGLVLLILFYIFSILGMALFSDLTTGEQLNSNIVNFKNFYFAFLLVCRMATGEDWNEIMHDVMNAKGPWSLVYFVVFNILVFFIGVQLFIAVVIENFRFVSELEQKGSISLMDLESFSELWGVFDPDKTEMISIEQLPVFLQQLCKPLGFIDKNMNTQKRIQSHQLVEINLADIGVLSVEDNYIHFTDLLLILVQRAFGKQEAQLITKEQHFISVTKLEQYIDALEQVYLEKKIAMIKDNEDDYVSDMLKSWWNCCNYSNNKQE
ncbi:Caveolin-2 [Balamuthia mandrillaris]